MATTSHLFLLFSTLRKRLLTSFIRTVYGVDFAPTIVDSFPTIVQLADKVRATGICWLCP